MLAPFILISVWHCKELRRDQFIKDYYYTNAESFQEISSYFKGLYSDNLIEARFKINTVRLKYRIEEKGAEDSYPIYRINIEQEQAYLALKELNQKYRNDGQYEDFTDIGAYFDDGGKMLLGINVYTEPIKKRRNIEYVNDVINYYLIYMDEDYKGYADYFGIDGENISLKSFDDGWCLWSQASPLG